MALTDMPIKYMLLSGSNKGIHHIAVAIAVCFVLLLVILIIALLKLKEYSKYKDYYKLLEKQLEHEKNIYKNVDRIYERTRIIRHDMKHYMTLVLGLIVNEEYKEAEKYIINLLNNSFSTSMISYTGSEVINAVINEKQVECEENNITLELIVNGSIPREKELDIAVVLSNLLDEAIGLEQECKDKRIILDMYEQKGMYYIIIKCNLQTDAFQAPVKSKMLSTENIKEYINRMDGSWQSFVEQGKQVYYATIPFLARD